ncbi:hypothetical protein [Neorhodopirellula lusitana]
MSGLQYLGRNAYLGKNASEAQSLLAVACASMNDQCIGKAQCIT